MEYGESNGHVTDDVTWPKDQDHGPAIILKSVRDSFEPTPCIILFSLYLLLLLIDFFVIMFGKLSCPSVRIHIFSPLNNVNVVSYSEPH